MKYKKCPKCEINFISETEEVCSVCACADVEIHQFNKKSITNDYSTIVCGRVYGTNSRTIYEKFCESLDWDKTKTKCFGFQTPLYAKNCDTNRENDVWFIYYPNYDKDKLYSVVDDFHAVNFILNDGEDIVEVVDQKEGKSNNANRITFVKTNAGYEFLGVYKIVENSLTRKYKRISKVYPL